MRLHQILERRIDNVKGAGAVPNNQEVDYFGIRVQMVPKMFLKLADPLEFSPDVEKTIMGLIDYLKQGGKIGSPFLEIALPEAWTENGVFDGKDLPVVKGHEGRHRMYALQVVDKDQPVEVHMFFRNGLRSRDITPEIISHLNKAIVSQYGRTIQGPIFS